MKFLKIFFINAITHIMLLPFIEIFACILAVMLGVAAYFPSFATSRYMMEQAGSFYYIFPNYQIETLGTPFFSQFYIFRYFYVTMDILSYFIESFDSTSLISTLFGLTLCSVLFLLYLFLYLFFIDYYSILWFNKTLPMLFTKEMIVDNDGYKITKRQIIVRNIIKICHIFFILVQVIRKSTLNVIFDDEYDCYIWSKMSQTRIITVQEYKDTIRLDKLKNIMHLQKVFTNQKNLFDMQYEQWKPPISQQVIKKDNSEYYQFYLEEQDRQSFYHDVRENDTIEQIVEQKQANMNFSFNHQYSQILDDVKENPSAYEPPIKSAVELELEKEDTIRKEMESALAPKTRSARLEKDYNQQYKDYLQNKEK